MANKTSKKNKIVKTNILKNDKSMYFIIFLFTFIFSILFYHNTFFYRATIQNVDNFIFANCSYFISRGLIIYKDIIDNKGPLLYLFNYIEFIFDKFHMVYFVTLLFHCITNIIIYKIARLKLNAKYSFIVLLLSNAFLISMLEEHLGSLTGTMCEFYALPFYSYVFYRYLKNDKYNKFDFFIFGICFAILFSLRVNLASISIVTTLFILYKYLKKKKYNLIINYILYFSLGAIVIFLPIIIYFIKNNALHNLFDSYFLFNVKYSNVINSNTSIIRKMISFGLISFKTFVDFTKNIFILSFFCIYITNLVQKKKIDENFIIFILCYAFAIFVSNRYYMHYIWILMPLSAIPFSMLFEGNRVKDINITILILVVISSIFFLLYALKHDYIDKRNDKGFPNDYVEMIDNLKSNSNENNKVFGVIKSNNYFYIDSLMLPAGDYVYQYEPDFMYEHFTTEFKKEIPDFVVYEINRDSNILKWNDFLQKELKSEFNKVYENNTYIIYSKK